MRRALLLTLIGDLLLAACGDSNGPRELSVCSGPVQLHVTSGTRPTITWFPSCLANQLVIQVQNGGPAWSVNFVVDINQLAPPVHYGVVPPLAIGMPMSPSPLSTGVTYTANLMADPVGANNVHVVGSINFTP